VESWFFLGTPCHVLCPGREDNTQCARDSYRRYKSRCGILLLTRLILLLLNISITSMTAHHMFTASVAPFYAMHPRSSKIPSNTGSEHIRFVRERDLADDELSCHRTDVGGGGDAGIVPGNSGLGDRSAGPLGCEGLMRHFPRRQFELFQPCAGIVVLSVDQSLARCTSIWIINALVKCHDVYEFLPTLQAVVAESPPDLFRIRGRFSFKV
jgi:hypothetical protein